MKGLNTDDGSKLSAYAVYRNLIPGVKSYEDHKPKNSKKKNKKIKQEKIEKDDNRNGAEDSTKSPHKQTVKKIAPVAATSPKRITPVKVGENLREIGSPRNKAGISEPPAVTPSENGGKNKKAKKRKAPANESNSPAEKQPKSNTSLSAATALNGKAKSSNSKKANAKGKNLGKNANKINTQGPPPKHVEKVAAQTKQKQNPSQLVTQLQPQPVKTSAQRNGTTKNAESKFPKTNIRSIINSNRIEDSVAHGKSAFEWMISPISSNNFFSEYWEKKPLHLKHKSSYYKWILSSELLDATMRENKLYFGKNVDLTSYTNGVRETLNPEGRALPAVVWDYYSNGCSIRILNPQTYIQNLWRLNASLQELFGTFVGANVYLTPPDTQGFAPHYDDIEAFILQIEGKKHWKLYAPRSDLEQLPRFSSGNFNEATDKIGKPILDVILEEGDMLYFPRGTIHQAKAVDGQHSLHITISCYQTNTYGDLLKEFLPMALEQAQRNSVKFRKGLPPDFLSFMGVAHVNSTNSAIIKKRKEFQKTMKNLIEDLITYPCDFAADQIGKKFISDSLPPFINENEKEHCVYGDGEFMVNGRVFNTCEISPDVEIKLIRKNCLRLISEENGIKVYFTLENSLEYHGEEPQVLEIPEEAVEAMQYLINIYPEYTMIQDLPIGDEILKLQVASDLWEKGLLMTKAQLTPTNADQVEVEELDEEEDINDDSDFSDDDGEEDLGEEIHEDSLDDATDSDEELEDM